MDTGKRFIYFNVLHGALTARHGMEFQPICARSIAICFRLTGHDPSEIRFLSFPCPGGPKKEQNQWCADACLGVARGTMPKRQPSVSMTVRPPLGRPAQRWSPALGDRRSVGRCRNGRAPARSLTARRALIASVDGRRAPALRVVAPVGRAARCSCFLLG